MDLYNLYIQAMPVGTYRVLSPGFPKIVYCPTLPLMREDETVDPFPEQVRMEESRHSLHTKYDVCSCIYYTECWGGRLWLLAYRIEHLCPELALAQNY